MVVHSNNTYSKTRRRRRRRKARRQTRRQTRWGRRWRRRTRRKKGRRRRRMRRRKHLRRYQRRDRLGGDPTTVICEECGKKRNVDDGMPFSKCPTCGHYMLMQRKEKSVTPTQSPHWVRTRKRDRVRDAFIAPLAATVRGVQRWRKNSQKRKKSGTRRRDLPKRAAQHLVKLVTTRGNTNRKGNSTAPPVQAPRSFYSNPNAWR